jgi:hypothetical protein
MVKFQNTKIQFYIIPYHAILPQKGVIGRLKLNMVRKCTLFPGRFTYFTMGQA